jgi:L-ascorbate metabolism protein UlaG (beta-lactamase superfamily)
MTITLDWLGTATFRLRIDDLTIFLDAYMDRVPAAPAVGLNAGDVSEADFVLVGHSHFDHLAGTEAIAANTGAQIIGSHETCRVMVQHEVPTDQLLPSSGGERHRLSADVTVQVFPSVHSCTWILTDAPCGEIEIGHTGLTEDEKAAQPGLVQRITEVATSGSEAGRQIMAHVQGCAGSTRDGGPLVYLIETPGLSIFFQDTSGCWTGVLDRIDADVAILAAAGRPNVDGEPNQGSMAQFIAMEAKMLGARQVFVGHHDDWMPPVTSPDFEMAPVRDELAREMPDTVLTETGYLAGTVLSAD